MLYVSKELGADEKTLLSSLMGSSLTSLEAVLVDNVNTAWNKVRIHSSCGTDIDICCVLESLPIADDGETDEFGVLSISDASNQPFNVESIDAEPCCINVDKEVSSIYVSLETIKSFYDDVPLVERSGAQAVIFRFTDDSFLSIDREVWFEEVLTIKFGSDMQSLINDDSDSWAVDPDEDMHTRFVYQSTVEEL